MNENAEVQAAEEFIDDSWGDEEVDLSDVKDVETDGEEAPEQPPEAEEDQTEATAEKEEKPEEPPKDEADQGFVLNYMGELKTVTREEAVALAQKGMDYDRIRQSRDEVSAEKAKLEKSVSFMAEIAKTQGITLDEMLDRAQAQMVAQKENISFDDAVKRVQFARKEQELAEREKALETKANEDTQKQEQAQKREMDIRNFVASYPGVDPKTIPQEVWVTVGKGATLSEAYARHEAQKLKLELEAERKNKENAERSAGSRDTKGQKDKADPIDKFWYED